MRILCLVSDTVRDATARQRHLLLTGLADQGHTVQEITAGSMGGSFSEPLACVRLWQLLRRWQPEVIHVWNPPGVLLGQFLTWTASGCRLVITATTPPHEKRHWLSPTAGRWLVPTEHLAKAWQAWGVPAERIKEIAPAVPSSTSSLSRADLLQACNLPPHARLILCLGPLTERAGHTSVLWAADMLHYIHDDLFLLIAGTGPEEEKVHTFAQNIYADRFTCFLQDRYSVTDLFPHADIVWEPTQRNEITDVAILAQHFGKPLQAVGQPCLQPLVHPQAVQWLPPHDPPLWAKQTHQLLQTPDRLQQMSQAGQRFAQEHFCTETYIARHIKQYERLLATPARTWLVQAA